VCRSLKQRVDAANITQTERDRLFHFLSGKGQIREHEPQHAESDLETAQSTVELEPPPAVSQFPAAETLAVAVELAKTLNHKIVQLSVRLAEVFGKSEPRMPAPDSIKTIPESVQHLFKDSGAIQALCTHRPIDPVAAVQIALQALLACVTVSYVETWTYNRDDSTFLEVFSALRSEVRVRCK